MPLQLYNTLTRKREKFIPIKKGKVSFYACGLTVYNYAHVGNLRSYLFEDVLKRVFLFNEGEPNSEILGGKGANLAIMSQQNLPIPKGFTISTESCIEYLSNDNKYPPDLWGQVKEALKQVESATGKSFGDTKNPLLLSVRSGAKISMPGMMDTILNVGLNLENVKTLSSESNQGRFIKDSFRRLIQMFGNIVANIPMNVFEDILDQEKSKGGIEFDNELSEKQLDTIIQLFLEYFESENGNPFPMDPLIQLDSSVQSVFKSWNNRRAINYRNHEGISHDIGTAVSIQEMVFGNLNNKSGTGVLFTRNPSTGENKLFGEYLLNAQGEDVVAGIRTPDPISELAESMPEAFKQLSDVAANLENHYRDMQDIEFTIQNNKLYLLQTRNGKRTGLAAAKIAFDMVNEGLITKEDAVKRITPRDVEVSLFPSVFWKSRRLLEYYDVDDLDHELKNRSLKDIQDTAPVKRTKIVGEGLPAGPGAACGHVVFDSDLAEAISKGEVPAPFEVTQFREVNGEMIPSMILVKKETSPEDFHGMVASKAIVTMTGGLTSHAALVGRQIGKQVIVGASSSRMDLLGEKLRTGDGDIIELGDVMSIEVIDKGLIFNQVLPIITPTKLSSQLETILDWADSFAKIKVRTNADKEGDTQIALDFKATGTGLARTEHMFFDSLDLMQEMILAETKEERLAALDKMGSIQKQDFISLFEVANGKPVTIRLLDPPLHEFLPKELEIRERTWVQILNPVTTEVNTRILRKVLYYQEANPMLGLRGVRLGLMFPEITIMQTRAIIEAGIEVKAKGIHVVPEIMVPLISYKNEFIETRKIIDKVAKDIFAKIGTSINYLVGAMIEIPRAALIADEIAEGELGADFFSFGTNDLHQMTLGFSRDDVGKFLPFYLENKLIEVDPFQSIDEGGVGKLMEMAVTLGRKSAEDAGKYLYCSICGESGADYRSIDFCYRIGLDAVSASPYRVPVARLAAAHATLNNPEPDPKYGKIWPTPKLKNN
ncbi:MAG: pyruvate, phosphate dikinase [Candidatus Heimdallarchaeota archaeon]|nr:pyruvate, phosphate dikinase [Candidatus Heimdallarchaeota archaeon]